MVVIVNCIFGVMAALRFLSLNCHGLNPGVIRYLQSIIMNFDVILLQETWLSESNCSKLQDISDNLIFFHSSSMEHKLSSGIYTGRSYGGTAVLIRKQFAQVTPTVTNSPRITAVHYHSVGQPDLIICSVYMPWNDRSVSQLDEYVATIGCLQGLVDSYFGCGFIFGGDFNVVKNIHTAACTHLNDFCRSNNLFWVDPDDCAVDYSYHCESSNHYSMIDYFICSPPLLQDMKSKSVIHVDEDNTSDHYAISLSTAGVNVSTNRQPVSNPCYKFRSDRADLSAYQDMCNSYLSCIELPVDALLCKTSNCSCHNSALNSYYAQIVDCVRSAADTCIPRVRVGVEKHWWSPELEDLKQQCVQITHIWRNSGCPRSGSLNDERVRIKMRYKCTIKEAVLASDLEFNDDLAKYLCKKDFNCFWKAWRKRFCHSNLTPTDCLNTKVGPENVLNEFTSHFKKVSMPNTAGADESYKNKVLHHLLINNESVDCVPFIDVSLILDKVCTLKPRKSGGHDSIQN